MPLGGNRTHCFFLKPEIAGEAFDPPGSSHQGRRGLFTAELFAAERLYVSCGWVIIGAGRDRCEAKALGATCSNRGN